MRQSGSRDPLTARAEWRSGPSLGKHQQLGRDSGRGMAAKFRFFLRPRTALGIALAILLLTAVGAVRVMTWDSAATSVVLEAGSSGEENSVGNPDPERTATSNADDGGPGYGLAASQDSGAGSVGSEVIVHVTGAVSSPGVVHLAAGARVLDAVDAAGGVTEDADVSAINLAAFVSDGSQVHVPVVGEAPRGGDLATGVSSVPGASSVSGACIDLNTASEAELEGLDGVGPKLAARIAQHREANGPFGSSSDLIAIDGIGPVLSAKIAEGACQ